MSTATPRAGSRPGSRPDSLQDLRRDESRRLYLALGRISRALRRQAAGAPLGVGALSALATLVGQGPMRPGVLAEFEGVSAPSMTRILASLEQLAAIRRTPDADDGRAYQVEATASGRRLVEAGRAARLQGLQRRLEALSDADQAAIVASLPALERLASGET